MPSCKPQTGKNTRTRAKAQARPTLPLPWGVDFILRCGSHHGRSTKFSNFRRPVFSCLRDPVPCAPACSCSTPTRKALHAAALSDSYLPAQGTSHYGGTGLPAGRTPRDAPAGRPSDRFGNIRVQHTRVPENQRIERVKYKASPSSVPNAFALMWFKPAGGRNARR
jgi:hypothetical protein